MKHIKEFNEYITESKAHEIMDVFVDAGWTSNAKHVNDIKDVINKISNKKNPQEIMDVFVDAGWTSNAKHVNDIKDVINKISQILK